MKNLANDIEKLEEKAEKLYLKYQTLNEKNDPNCVKYYRAYDNALRTVRYLKQANHSFNQMLDYIKSIN